MRDRSLSPNPITRARLQVEAEVPLSRRGPGWDRHWRELEAYFDEQGEWSVPSGARSEAEPEPEPETPAGDRPDD